MSRTRKPSWLIKNRIIESLRLRPMSLSELAKSIDSDMATTERHIKDLMHVAEKLGYPHILKTDFANFRGAEVVEIYSIK